MIFSVVVDRINAAKGSQRPEQPAQEISLLYIVVKKLVEASNLLPRPHLLIHTISIN